MAERVGDMTLVREHATQGDGVFERLRRTLAGVGTSNTRMSENGRLAMDLLHHDLRSAGFLGCRPRGSTALVSTLNAGNGAFLNPAAGDLIGYKGTGAGFTPALSAALAALTGP